MAYSPRIFSLNRRLTSLVTGEVKGNDVHNSTFEVAEMKQFIANFLKDEEGLTMVEYAIAGALVAAGAVVAFTYLGTQVSSRINTLGNDVAS